MTKHELIMKTFHDCIRFTKDSENFNVIKAFYMCICASTRILGTNLYITQGNRLVLSEWSNIPSEWLISDCDDMRDRELKSFEEFYELFKVELFETVYSRLVAVQK